MAAVRRPDRRTSVSREQILAAAVDCLLASGYAATTTLMVQAKAGVSRGRLLHHFPTRGSLLIAAAGHVATVRLAETEQLAAHEILDEGPDRLDAAVALMWSSFQQPHFWATAELWSAARTEPALRAGLLEQERANGAAIRRIVAQMFGSFADHELYPEVRDLLLTSMRGVALTYAFDQRKPARDDPHLVYWRTLARELLLDSPARCAREEKRCEVVQPL